jgi:hypothetical protein
MHKPFDEACFATLPAAPAAPSSVQRARSWGEAPDSLSFLGGAGKLALLRQLGVGRALSPGSDPRHRPVSARRAWRPGWPRTWRRGSSGVYWRSLRDARPVSEWLAGAIGFLSDQQVVPPVAEGKRLNGAAAVAACVAMPPGARQLRDPCSNPANPRPAVGQAWLDTLACCRPWVMAAPELSRTDQRDGIDRRPTCGRADH